MPAENLYAIYGLIFRAYELLTGYSAMGFRGRGDARMVRCPSAFITGLQGRHKERDRHPSCNLDPGKNTYICYACGLEGGLYQFVKLFGKHEEFPMLLPGQAPEEGQIYRKNDDHGAALWLERAMHITLPAQLKPQPPMKRSKRAIKALGNERIAGVHPHTDENGTTLFEIVRIVGAGTDGARDKYFDARRPIAQQKKACWKCGTYCGYAHDVKGVRIVPYLLPDLVRARREGRVVLLVEGERDADVLRTLGFIATSIPFGAHFPLRTSWRAFFADIPILFIIPDADMHPGRIKAAQRAHILTGGPKRIVLADLWPDCTQGEDVSDFAASALGIDPKQIDVVAALQAATADTRSAIAARLQEMLRAAAALGGDAVAGLPTSRARFAHVRPEVPAAPEGGTPAFVATPSVLDIENACLEGAA